MWCKLLKENVSFNIAYHTQQMPTKSYLEIHVKWECVIYIQAAGYSFSTEKFGLTMKQWNSFRLFHYCRWAEMTQEAGTF